MNIKYQRKKFLDYDKCKYRHLINFLDSWLIFDLMKTMVVHKKKFLEIYFDHAQRNFKI